MAPLKSFLLVSSGIASALTCSNDNCEAGDQTALLQSHLTRKSELALSSTGAAFFPKLGNLNDPSTRKSALLEIQKTAVKLASMDASEATPVVIEVCTDTAQMLNETVLYAIIQEDAVDRAELASAFGQFAQHEDSRVAAETALTTALSDITRFEELLLTCRTEETAMCVTIEECVPEPPVCIPCTTCHNCEHPDSLCQIDQEIEARWCVGSTEPERMADSDEGLSWRMETKTLFQRYQDAAELCRVSCLECTELTTNCETIVDEYREKAHDCNTDYVNWENAKCNQYQIVNGQVALYQQAFLATLTAYNNVVARVMIEEADRKVEWEVLTRVICLLLTLTTTEDGATASDGNQLLIQRCWDEDVDTTHLDIDYEPAPTIGEIPVVEPPCAGSNLPFMDAIYGIDISSALSADGHKYGPSTSCEGAIVAHGSEALTTWLDREACCDGLVTETATLPAFQLGHFLLIDPTVEDISTQLSETQWSAQISGASATATTMVGSMSAPHVGALPDVTSDFFSQEEIDAGSVIASVSWAYGSSQAFPAGALTLEERFAQGGGLMYLNSAGAVIAVRELASSTTDLNQAATAFMSFELSKDITAAEFTDTCGTGHDVTDSQHRTLGAEKYCWTQGALSGDADGGWSCTEGCFVYQTTTGHVAFPHIATMSASLGGSD